ncbi:hypothetical protein RCL1_003363 [Eukaryota sp. TZLM3-RCL]
MPRKFEHIFRGERATAVVAVEALIDFIAQSNAQTLMDLKNQIYEVVAEMRKESQAISLNAGTTLFLKFVTLSSLDEYSDFDKCKKEILDRGRLFIARASNAWNIIANNAQSLFFDGDVVLIHGYSRVVCKVLESISRNRQLTVFVTESSPMNNGYRTARLLAKSIANLHIITDSSVASVLPRVSSVLLGADGITENGGIVNQVGTFGLAIAAKHLGKPCYVAAESYKFMRYFPLTQQDIDQYSEHEVCQPQLPRDCSECQSLAGLRQSIVVDYTPPQYLDLLITDIGILTPSAVSDQLIKLYM